MSLQIEEVETVDLPKTKFKKTSKFKYYFLRIFVPLITILKNLSLIPRVWFPAVYLGNRQIIIGQKNNEYPDNHVSNAKYTWLTFVVHNILEQFFMSHLNRYFLLLAIVELWKDVRVVNPWTTWLPMIMIFSFTGFLAAIDDIRRGISDIKMNNKSVNVVRKGILKKIFAKRIRVGDIVKVKENEEIPCDMVVFDSSEKNGMAYIQTANLDGEIDLKSRPIPKNLDDFIKELGSDWYKEIKGKITCEQPNSEIYQFNASLKLEGMDDDVSLSAFQLLLQSCVLKNTDWVLGICVYNGNETKCGMNKKRVPSKRAQSDHFLDRIGIVIFIIQMLILFLFGMFGYIIKSYNRSIGLFYLAYEPITDDPFYWQIVDELIMPVRFWQLTTYMIPISLKVTIDIMKVWFSLLVVYDRDMYDEETNTCASARNSTIVEDLGQIEYILSDKTGTLTQNVMEFQRCSIGLKSYDYSKKVEEGVESDLNILKEKISKNDENVCWFFKTLCICHGCKREIDSNGKVVFRSVSPDEEALVQASCDVGMSLTSTDNDIYSITYHHMKDAEDWKILKVFKFTSERKRMSVLAKNLKSGKIVLFSKGADNVMFNLIEKSHFLESTEKDVNRFATMGLRILVVAYKEIKKKDFIAWKSQMTKAENVVGKERQSELDKVYGILENNLILIGTTAIEDKLQDKVPETIKSLREAGISVWMLTGDKVETAEQIGYSCNLITKGENLIHIVGNTIEEITTCVDDSIRKGSDVKKYSVIVEGETLRIGWETLKETFQLFLLSANTVICARVTPSQKAEIVKFVKKQKKVTLAIGDGGNDVPMIQEAHVGIGLTGKEGLQASRAADFSFGKFKLIIPLLFVHGHYSLYRNGFVIQYSFYKNMVLAVLQLTYNLFNNFRYLFIFS